MASALATSEASLPNDPIRRTRTRSPTELHVGDHRAEPVRDLVEVDDPLDRLAQRLVHDRDRPDPSHRLLEREAGRRLVDPPGLESQQRRDGLEVVLHPVVDLPDRRVLGDQLAVTAAQVGDVADQHHRPEVVRAPAQGDRPDDQGHRRRADLGVAVPAAGEHRAEGLLVGTAQRGHQPAGDLGQRGADQVTVEPEPAVDRERVGARVGDRPVGVQSQEAVTDTRRVGVVAALPGRGKLPSAIIWVRSAAVWR